MEARSYNPLEQPQGWVTEPTREFHVELWFAPESGTMWSSAEYRLTEAEDVHEAIAWADAQATRRGATYALYAVVDEQGEGRVWLAGNKPTWPGENFARQRG